jgi:tetraacyldisaccharide 4'-kinase
MKHGIDLHHPPLAWTAVTWAPSLLYSAYQHLRGWLFARQWRQVRRLDTPVLSVGNLTVGGTGKTPVTAFLAEYLIGRGFRPVILSRGYGGRSGGDGDASGVKVVADGQSVLMNPTTAGDEPYLLAMKLPGVPVLCHPDRYTAGRWAERHLHPDIILLDDGFQHMKLHRDFDLLLMDGLSPLGNGRVLPAGPLREPAKALRRATAVLLTRCPEAASADHATMWLERIAPEVPVHTSEFRPAGLFPAEGSPSTDLAGFRDKRVVAFCGIAHPGQFFRMLGDAGLELGACLAFDDHQPYGEAERKRIVAACERSGAIAALTTRKDLVKIKSGGLPCPLYGVELEIQLHQYEWLEAMVAKLLPGGGC